MESSIHISSEQIQVIGYAGSVIKAYVTYPIPEGTLINGMITDRSFLVECLSSLRGEYPDLFKNPTLVVDGSAILVKRIAAPKLNTKQYRQLVRDDFAESADNADELVCGHELLSGGTSLLACAANKNLVDSYTAAFKSVGVKLAAIRIGTQAIISYVDARPELRQKSFVLNVIDGVMMLSVIFENGVNVFISRTRLYGDTKEQLAQTILENLGGLIQFNRSQKFGEITDSYYLGVSAPDLRLLDALNTHPAVKLAVLDIFENVRGAEQLPPNAHFTYLNTLLDKNDIDLIAGRRELDMLQRQKRPKKLWIPLLAAYVLLLALPIAYFYYQVRQVDVKIDAVNEVLQDPANIAKSAELTALEMEMASFGGVVREHESRLEYEGTLSDISSRVIDLIINGFGDRVTITNLSYEEKGSVIHISGFGESEAVTENYSDMLRANELIAGVNYIGYGKEYSFSWDIILATAKEVNP